MTATDLLTLRLEHKSTELVRGKLIVREPPSTYHGRVQSNLNLVVASHVRAHALGVVFGQDIVDRARVAQIPPRGYAAMAPDLVAEILPPDDSPGELLAKVGEWLEAGVRLVWVIDPERRVATEYRADGSVATIASDSNVSGEPVLPGFSFRLAELFD